MTIPPSGRLSRTYQSNDPDLEEVHVAMVCPSCSRETWFVQENEQFDADFWEEWSFRCAHCGTVFLWDTRRDPDDPGWAETTTKAGMVDPPWLWDQMEDEP